MNKLQEMPKIELHVHLDGSMRLETASQWSKESLDVVREKMEAPIDCVDLNNYLTKFSFPLSLLQTKDHLTRVAYELVEDLEKDHVIYAEIRFAPILHTKQGLSLQEVVEAVLDGLKKGRIKCGLLLCLMRNEKEENNRKVIEVAKQYLGKGVVGLDLAGAEGMYPTSNFASLFQEAQKQNIPFTIHAGEADGPSSILSAIQFGAKRLGHGVRIIEDSSLMQLAKKQDITLEICPSSNLQTRIVTNYADHPLFALFNQGLHVTINTDNRTVSNITLTQEYQKLKDAFPFAEEDFKAMNLYAVQASFLPEEEKQQLVEEYLSQWEQYLHIHYSKNN